MDRLIKGLRKAGVSIKGYMISKTTALTAVVLKRTSAGNQPMGGRQPSHVADSTCET